MLNIVKDDTVYTVKDVEYAWALYFIGVHVGSADDKKCKIRVVGDSITEVINALKSLNSTDDEYTVKTVLAGKYKSYPIYC